jgi:hypothetical protein
MIINYLVA